MIPRPNVSIAKFSSKNSENLNALMQELIKEEELLARAEEANNLTEENVRNLRVLNLDAPEWKIKPGDSRNEVIPQNLLLLPLQQSLAQKQQSLAQKQKHQTRRQMRKRKTRKFRRGG
jgi:hypothetical protein